VYWKRCKLQPLTRSSDR